MFQLSTLFSYLFISSLFYLSFLNIPSLELRIQISLGFCSKKKINKSFRRVLVFDSSLKVQVYVNVKCVAMYSHDFTSVLTWRSQDLKFGELETLSCLHNLFTIEMSFPPFLVQVDSRFLLTNEGFQVRKRVRYLKQTFQTLHQWRSKKWSISFCNRFYIFFQCDLITNYVNRQLHFTSSNSVEISTPQHYDMDPCSLNIGFQNKIIFIFFISIEHREYHQYCSTIVFRKQKHFI